MVFDNQKPKLNYITVIIIVLAASLSGIYILKESGIIGRAIGTEVLTGDPNLALNITFDDQNSPFKDYSIYNHQFSVQGNVQWANDNVCKWYGCADFTQNTRGSSIQDYLNSSSKWNSTDGMAVSFWVYHTGGQLDGGNSHMHYQIGNGQTRQVSAVGAYGVGPEWEANSGTVTYSAGESKNPRPDQWYHIFQMYDPNKGTLYEWQNGVLVINISQPYGSLKHSLGDEIKLGAGHSGVDLRGYLDEIQIYSKSNFTSDDIKKIYNARRLGTPPTLDLYVKAIKYDLPRDWTQKNNPLTLGSMPIRITIANAGTQNSGSFSYRIDLDDTTVCSGTISLNAQGEQEIVCNWQSSYGYHKGYVVIDQSDSQQEDNENNNVQRIYIPFLDRPYFHFSIDEWNNVIKPYSSNPVNTVAYNSYQWAINFDSEPWQSGWSGNDVDPRAKKGRENAMSCMINSYKDPQGRNMCNDAKNYLLGWASRDLSSYSDVQQIHELSHVGITYDIMFPILTESEHDTVIKGFHDICQHITNLQNTRPDLDDDSLIQGDNGFGFGAGMAGFCYSIVGEYSENPTLIQQIDDQYWGKNIPDEWMDREQRYLQSYKNDSWAKYQEGWLYKTYSQYHLVENWLFEKRFGLKDIEQYQPALCAMARESLTEILDFTYNGKTLRNDEDRYMRAVQRGDSNSYQHPTDGSFIEYGVLTYYGVLCDDVNTKKSILQLRDLVHTKDTVSQNDYVEMYLYKQLVDGANSAQGSIDKLMPKVIFDNANDILTIRTNYTYLNDNVIEIDGGDERGSGHSQAQGYYLYALGEPFLDYEQVPYEDDVRMEAWKNGVSLQNDVQSVEGQLSYYSENCGTARLNQYYGMSNCPKPKYPQDYPDYRHFPLQYGGDLEDYIGTKDANFAGVYVWRPYKNANPVEEYFVKFGDLLAKRTIVSGNTESKGVYHNFINVYNEFSEARSGTDLTFTRNSKNLDIKLMYSSQPMTLNGGLSGINLCFTKTDCSGNNRGNSKYRRTYLYSAANNVDFILAHHWYLTGQKQSMTSISGSDKGIQQGSNVVIFDTDGDKNSAYGNKNATGWALAFNDATKEIGAFNTTSMNIGAMQILSSQNPISVHIKRDSAKIVVTANTMERKSHIDYPKKVRVTIDAQELTNNNGFIVTKNSNENVQVVSESGTLVTFDVESGQNSDAYTIIGSGTDSIPPTIISALNGTTTNQSAYIIVATNENSNVSINYGYSQGTLASTATSTSFQTSSSVYLPNLIANSTVYFSVTACDVSRNCNAQSGLSFKTAETYVPPPDLTAPVLNQTYNYSTTNQSSFIRVQANEISNVSVQWGYSQDSLVNSVSKSSFSTTSNLFVSGLVSNTSVYYSVTLCDLSQNCVTNGTFSFKTLSTTQVMPGIPPIANKFDGATTDFSKITDLANVTNVTIESSVLGKISFPGLSNVSGLDLDSYVNITNGSISLDSNALKVLNKTAILSIYGLSLINPQILVDGVACPASICTFISYSSGTLQFMVSHFTKYSTEETAQSSSSSGGSTQTTSGGSGGGGGGGSGKGKTQAGSPKTDSKSSKTIQRVLEEPGNIISDGGDIEVDLTGSALEQKPDSSKTSIALKVETAKRNKWELAALVLAVVLMTASVGFFSLRYYKQR